MVLIRRVVIRRKRGRVLLLKLLFSCMTVSPFVLRVLMIIIGVTVSLIILRVILKIRVVRRKTLLPLNYFWRRCRPLSQRLIPVLSNRLIVLLFGG